MREIKFKLLYKAKRARKWIVSQSFEIKELQESGFQFDFSDGTYLMSNEIPPFNDKDEYGETKLVQYTGLKDKNGKEIYEGDWIKGRGEVMCGNQFGQVTFRRIFKKGKTKEYLFHEIVQGDEIEVIGNIYENPELLTHKPI